MRMFIRIVDFIGLSASVGPECSSLFLSSKNECQKADRPHHSPELQFFDNVIRKSYGSSNMVPVE